MWEKMTTNIRKVASEVCGVTKGSGGEAKDTWWWNEEIQRAIKKKKECYRRLYQVKCIKDENEHLLVKEDEIRHRWQEYFDKLFNGENIDTTFSWLTLLMTPIGALCG